jgi:branched-chain amino acid transport system permease protein
MSPSRRSWLQWVAPAAVLVLLCLPPGLYSSRSYELRIATLVLMYAGMATAWNIVGGFANLVSLGHAAFFGLGAYTSTLLLKHQGLPPWGGMVAAFTVAGMASLVIGWPSFRLRGHYFALGTIAFAELFRLPALYFSKLTGGAVGLTVPRKSDGWLYMQFAGNREFFWIAVGMFVATLAATYWVHRSALGYRLRALRSSHDAAEVVGVNTLRAKLVANFVSCSILGAYGVFYAQFHFFIDPDTVFGLWTVSIKIAMMAILGGLAYVWGPFVGALILVPLDEWTNAVFTGRFSGTGRLLFGALLIALILFQPRGVMRLLETLGTKIWPRPKGVPAPVARTGP